MDEEDAEQIVIEITRVELKRTYGESTVRGKDREGHLHIFHFLPKTRVRRLVPRDSTQTLAEILRGEGISSQESASQSLFPLVEKQDVLVAWKHYPGTDRKVAVKFTVFVSKE